MAKALVAGFWSVTEELYSGRCGSVVGLVSVVTRVSNSFITVILLVVLEGWEKCRNESRVRRLNESN